MALNNECNLKQAEPSQEDHKNGHISSSCFQFATGHKTMLCFHAERGNVAYLYGGRCLMEQCT